MELAKKTRVITEEEEVSGEVIGASIFLYEDIIEEVLLRVPPKTLCKFKCLSKHWKKIISEQSFINSFIRKAKSQPIPPLITGFFYTDIKEQVKFHRFDDENDFNVAVDASLSFLQQHVSSFYVITTSHNGILLCAEKPKTGWYSVPYLVRYFVCNPFTKQYLSLPEPHRKHYVKPTVMYCYDRKHGDNAGQQLLEFKVVCFSNFSCNVMDIEMYSSETGRWKENRIYHDFSSFCYGPSQTFLFDGNVYLWSINWSYFCVYDLNKESIRFVEVPGTTPSGKGLLGVSSGSLHYALADSTHLEVWILLEGKWCLKNKMEHKSLKFGSTTLFHPLAFHPLNDELVLVRLGRKVFLFRVDKVKIEDIANLNPEFCFTIIPYSLPTVLPSLTRTTK